MCKCSWKEKNWSFFAEQWFLANENFRELIRLKISMGLWKTVVYNGIYSVATIPTAKIGYTKVCPLETNILHFDTYSNLTLACRLQIHYCVIITRFFHLLHSLFWRSNRIHRVHNNFLWSVHCTIVTMQVVSLLTTHEHWRRAVTYCSKINFFWWIAI